MESKCQQFKYENPEILDILLFGSMMKGKDKANDLDLLIVFKEKKNLNLMYEFRKVIEPFVKVRVEVTGKTYAELFSDSFLAREAILAEAYSLIQKKSVAEGLGFKNFYLFNYSLKKKNKSERMRFYYSLYGRNSLGILKKLGAVKYAETIILCPTENKELMKGFLESWKIEFKETPILIPKRIL
ncbi:nucleotidyltransferase domain-containing protein [Candidatus Woesearchaeota archaeon]|nr:nucleotidyltransferase domain-containing protein [Candidatus Woesearchaeota archaeon]